MFILLVVGDQSLGDGLSHSASSHVSISPSDDCQGPANGFHNAQRNVRIAETNRSRNILDLRSVTTTGDTDADVQASELVEANDKEGLVDLELRKPSAWLFP